MTAIVAAELLTRLESLAIARHTGTDTLLSEAIRSYLDREEPNCVLARHRVPGGDEGRVFVAPDFDTPLPAEIEDSFYE